MKRKRLLAVAGVGIGAILMLLGLMQTQWAAHLVLTQAGNALGLNMRADSLAYRLRGTPELALSNLDVRLKENDAPLLQAKHIFIALPWRTLRSAGGEFVFNKIELDSPTLDLPSLQHWLALRPSTGQTRLPALSDGLRIKNGVLRNDDWQIQDIQLSVAAFDPQHPLHMNVQGRYVDMPLSIPADLDLSIQSPQALATQQASIIEGRGTLAMHGEGWVLPAYILLRGSLRIGKDSALLKPAKLGIAGQYHAGATHIPFRLGAYGPLLFNEATWRFVPASFVASGGALIPNLHARGQLIFGKQLRINLNGQLNNWPDAWPALPAPISNTPAPFPFSLRYTGKPDFSSTTALTLARGETRLDTSFQLPQLLQWLDAAENNTPLPPLRGTLTTPRIVSNGVALEGVELELDPGDE